MKILLIGNGFDLEHNLPTSYREFLDFCERAKRIYTYSDEVPLNDYKKNNLDDWKMDAYVKERLETAFKNRKCKKIFHEGGTYDIEITTPDVMLDELYTHIKHNTWIEYFLICTSYRGENWIDFETEISRVIQAIDEARVTTSNGNSIEYVQRDKGEILINILKASKGSLQKAFRDTIAIDTFASQLNIELERLIRALEIYISEFVHGITVIKKSVDIEKLSPDYVLSFNYSDTYERVYDKEMKAEYSYIHGKADINKNVSNSNIVLGIDEYLDNKRKDKELEFLVFKKFYQRIYKSTCNNYLDWVDEIKVEYNDFLKKESEAYSRMIDMFKEGSFEQFQLQKTGCSELPNKGYAEHTLYIFGHSLDITDRDVLKLFICNDNVQTKVFYYRKNKDDKEVLGKLIRNLIQIMGQDELLRRTGGVHKTIEFIPQEISITCGNS